MAAKRNPKEERRIARERVEVLFSKADDVFGERPDLSQRYVTLARKIAMKYKLRIPSNLQKKFCKHCYRYLRPGVNCRVRTRDGKVVYSCLSCKKFMRFPVKKEQKAKRKK